MRIAITGTPCVGKTTLAQLLRERGETVMDLKAWAQEVGAVTDVEADGTLLIDTEALPVDALPKRCFIEGHMAHHLAVDASWVIRCDPTVLKPRLAARGYAPAKIRENLEAEAMDLILQEAVALGPVRQRDATRRSAEELLAAFADGWTDTFKGHELEPVDWSSWLMENT